MKKEILEMARAAGLSVCVNAESTFNRQVENFSTAVQAPLLAEIDALHVELAKTKAPPCPTGLIEHHAKIDGVELVFHFEYLPAEKPHCALDYRSHSTMQPVAWFHRGENITDVFDIDAKNNTRICNEALAAYEDSK